MQKLLIGVPIAFFGLLIGGFMLLVLLIGFLTFTITGMNKEEVVETPTGDATTQYNVNVSKLGLNEIPQEYMKAYQDAGKAYGVPWTLISAIHRVETNFGSDLNTSSAGAIGHTQFMVKTWVIFGEKYQ